MMTNDEMLGGETDDGKLDSSIGGQKSGATLRVGHFGRYGVAHGGFDGGVLCAGGVVGIGDPADREKIGDPDGS